MSEEEVIRKRLLIDGDGTGDDRRLNVLIKAITKWPEITDDNPIDRQVTLDKMLNQLCSCEFALHKSLLLDKTSKNQLEKYKLLQSKLEDKIVEVKRQMEDSKNTLAQAKVLKQNRMMYDLMAQSIEEHPARKDTNVCLENVKGAVQELQEQKKMLEQKLDSKSKQFFVLVSSANSLRVMLDESNDNGLSNSLDDITNSPGPEAMSE